MLSQESVAASQEESDEEALESASESGYGLCSSSSDEDESVRMRVRRQILQRVQELQVASGNDSDAQLDAQMHAYSAALHASQECLSTSPSSSPEAEVLDLEHLRTDVISVAEQILERHLSRHQPQHYQQQQTKQTKHESAAAALELRLVHRLLAKESELLALQALRQPRAAGIAAVHRRRGRQMNVV